MRRKNKTSTFVPVALAAFVALVGGVAVADEDIANTIAKAANYIYSSDFILDSVTDTFSDDELQTLGESPDALNSMIGGVLGSQHSVGGAMLMAHFGLKDNFDNLRYRMLEPGRTYGWEGTDSNDAERYYSDHQYVYHSKYLLAIEELMGAPLHEVIELTDRERKRIDDLAANSSHESHHWAAWISRKLGL